jgi:hypothetical protein
MLLAEKPIVASTYSAMAVDAPPAPTRANAAVDAMPSAAKINRSRFFVPPRSAIAPSTGDSSAMATLPIAFATPSSNVLAVASPAPLQ